MPSIIPVTLPVIDIAPYLTEGNEEARANTSRELHNACKEYGFFYLDLTSYVSTDETDELRRLAREFFALSQTEKNKISLANQDGARGYARLNENMTNGKADNHEGIDFYRPVEEPDKTKPLWGTNQWPSVPGYQEKYEQWVTKMKSLGVLVMEAMSVGLGMDREEWHELRASVDDSFWVMRTIGYPPLPNDHDGFSCGSHKDYGCLTFLYADPTPSALQVYTSRRDLPGADTSGLPTDGVSSESEGTWINADPIPGCVVCNVGEMWEIWSNGLYKSTLHRVVHRGSNYRVSIPFFFEPSFDARVKPLAAALREQEKEGTKPPKDYDSVVYGEFLMDKVGNNFGTGKGKYDTD